MKCVDDIYFAKSHGWHSYKIYCSCHSNLVEADHENSQSEMCGWSYEKSEKLQSTCNGWNTLKTDFKKQAEKREMKA